MSREPPPIRMARPSRNSASACSQHKNTSSSATPKATPKAPSLDTKGLPDGEYRLVGQLLGFCPANAIIDINSHSPQKKPIVIRMNLPGTDTCSTVQVSKK